jgi:hypothetical protein
MPFRHVPPGVILLACALAAQTAEPKIPVNYDEAQVGTYTLPDPLTFPNGAKVRNEKDWYEKRRPQILNLFEENMHGHSPGRPPAMKFDVFEKSGSAFDGKAIRRQITIFFNGDSNGPKADLLLYLPAAAKSRVPVLLNLSFSANSRTVDDPGVRPGEVWNREHKRVPAAQGMAIGRVTRVPDLLDAGFGFATIYYGDIEPDFAGGAQYGIRGAYLKPGQAEPGPLDWGAIGAWAWGLSRAMDYLGTDPGVDSKRVAILGISRLGKTVLWAGAQDTRFAMVIASCSGEGGAALSRRNYGETVKNLNVNFGYQFAGRYQNFGDRVDELPVDSNMLLSLIAPRPLLLQTGDQDKWSDPRGEFLAAVAAGPMWKLLGKDDLGTTEMPAPGTPILHTLGYEMHAGGHGTVPSDWDVFLESLRLHLK